MAKSWEKTYEGKKERRKERDRGLWVSSQTDTHTHTQRHVHLPLLVVLLNLISLKSECSWFSFCFPYLLFRLEREAFFFSSMEKSDTACDVFETVFFHRWMKCGDSVSKAYVCVCVCLVCFYGWCVSLGWEGEGAKANLSV